MFETLQPRNQETNNQEAKKPRHQETKQPRNQETKKPRNQETHNLFYFQRRDVPQQKLRECLYIAIYG